jgi:hypothetical protein
MTSAKYLKDAENKQISFQPLDDGQFGFFVSGIYVGKKSKEWMEDLEKHIKENEVTVKLV